MYVNVSQYVNEVFVGDIVMSATLVYCKNETELNVIDVENILREVDTTRVSIQTAQKPKGGEVYIYPYGNEATKHDWIADGYRWSNIGCDRLPRSQPVLYKRKFRTVKSDGTPSQFKRVAYSIIGQSAPNSYVLVHYLGDETTAEELPLSVIAQRVPRAKGRQTLEQHCLVANADRICNQSSCLTEVNINNIQVEVIFFF